MKPPKQFRLESPRTEMCQFRTLIGLTSNHKTYSRHPVDMTRWRSNTSGLPPADGRKRSARPTRAARIATRRLSPRSNSALLAVIKIAGGRAAARRVAVVGEPGSEYRPGTRFAELLEPNHDWINALFGRTFYLIEDAFQALDTAVKIVWINPNIGPSVDYRGALGDLAPKSYCGLATYSSRMYIPDRVKRQLRSEIGFGCPVEGCGSPYLTYHHFDPPRRVREHNEPAGMIALCRKHHDDAEGGAFTDDQLRTLKVEGIERNRRIAGSFLWRRQQLLIHAGQTLTFEAVVPLAFNGVPVVSLTRDESGILLLSINMLTTSISPRLRMFENDWVSVGNPTDLEAPPLAERSPLLMLMEMKSNLSSKP